MRITTTAQYEALTDALMRAGYTVDTVYEALKESGFNVELKGEIYEGVYVSRVIAMMHNSEARSSSRSAKPALKL